MTAGSWKDPTVRRLMYLLVTIFIFAGAIGLFFAGAPLVNPSYCGRICHAMNPQYQTWLKSSHVNVACNNCHRDSSYVGISTDRFVKPIERIASTKESSALQPLNADNEYSRKKLPDLWCLECHPTPITKAIAKGGLRLGKKMHSRHKKAGLRCTTCHNRIAHPGAERYYKLEAGRDSFAYKDFMTMSEGCWRCHSENDKYQEKETRAITGDYEAKTKCTLCHDPKATLKPIKGTVNHDRKDGAPWKDGIVHGPAAKVDFDDCLVCHETRSTKNARIPDCSTSCHNGIAMPHNIPMWSTYFNLIDSSWVDTHGSFAAENEIKPTSRWNIEDSKAICSSCHDNGAKDANYCQSCHHKQFPEAQFKLSDPWGEKHASVVRKIGAAPCYECHNNDYCAFCHIKSQEGSF